MGVAPIELKYTSKIHIKVFVKILSPSKPAQALPENFRFALKILIYILISIKWKSWIYIFNLKGWGDFNYVPSLSLLRKENQFHQIIHLLPSDLYELFFFSSSVLWSNHLFLLSLLVAPISMDGRWCVEPWKKVQSKKESRRLCWEGDLVVVILRYPRTPFFRRVLSEDVKDLELKKETFVCSSCAFVLESCPSCCEWCLWLGLVKAFETEVIIRCDKSGTDKWKFPLFA